MAVALPFIMMGISAASVGMGAYSMATAPSAPKNTSDETAQQKQALQSAYAQSQLMRKRQGMGSTILTGPSGVTQPANTGKSILG